MIIFVGDKPSPKMKPDALPFEGAACEETFKSWVSFIEGGNPVRVISLPNNEGSAWVQALKNNMSPNTNKYGFYLSANKSNLSFIHLTEFPLVQHFSQTTITHKLHHNLHKQKENISV